MEVTLNVDLGQVAREVGLPVAKVQPTVELLDDGNTVPFITRYRKDQTGGLDEEQVRQVQHAVVKLRALADRKQRILKSLQSQEKLTDELQARIEAADSLRLVEDLYLPFKPKKRTLAETARERGLDPLAKEILEGSPTIADLDARAAEFVSAEKELADVAAVLQGARHLIAETFGENLQVRDELRKILASTGKLVCRKAEEVQEKPEQDASDEDEPEDEDVPEADPEPDDAPPAEPAATDDAVSQEPESSPPAAPPEPVEPAAPAAAEELPVEAAEPQALVVESQATELVEQPVAEERAAAVDEAAELTTEAAPEAVSEAATEVPTEAQTEPSAAEPVVESETAAQADSEQPAAEPVVTEPAETVTTETTSATLPPAEPDAAPAETAAPAKKPLKKAKNKPLAAKISVKQLAAQTRKEAKKRKRQKKIESFKDYFKFQEALDKVPPHRLLAINRGERSKILRVKIDADWDAVTKKAEEMLVPAWHPQTEFLKACLRDALNRLVIPSLEREIRREMTERAETHAASVFAQNLRKLLLQPPVRDRRVLAIDPGFRSGCKLAALDEFGNVLGHTVIHVIGKAEIVQRGRQQIVEMITMYHVPVIAIGNGTACRETERLVADIIAKELHGQDIRYVIVNEAGASVYSTSTLGREELPKFDPVLRSAVSIGRRLQDPLSELVKINPANIGVGLYQHDVKASHLRDSLDDVVESCVNFVGVDVNSASPSLLRYVSGLNQLTARRLFEYRQQHGPFRSRDDFRKVPGFGEATFVQAAGFLKIVHGDNPLDATWIHPESYETAVRVIEKLGANVEDLATTVGGKPAERKKPSFAHGVTDEEPAAEPPAEATAAAEATEATDAAEAVSVDAPVAVDAAPESSPEQPAEPADVTAEAASEPTATTDEPSATEERASEPSATEDSTPVAEETPAAAADTAEPPAAEPPAAEEPAAEEPAVEEPAVEEPAVEEPAVEEPAVEEPAVEEPAVEEPAAEATVAETPAPASPRLPTLAAQADPGAIAAELQIGRLLAKDILNSLTRPGRDPREDLPPPTFRTEVIKLEDLEAGMELSGTVLNVVDFGAFVDIGLPDSGLVHISRLADRYVKDPHEVVSVGDMLTVWVVEVDKNRRRVSLSAIQPGTETPPEQRQRKPRPEGKRDRPPRKQADKQGDKPRGRRDGDRNQGRRQKFEKPKERPKPPAPPITEKMAEGKEPMRSFSDLLQFYEKKTDKDDDKDNKKKKGKS